MRQALISANSKLVQDNADAGRIGGIIRRLLQGKKNLGFNLDSITNGTEIITNEKTIHGMVTQFFEQWFAPPDGINYGLMAERGEH